MPSRLPFAIAGALLSVLPAFADLDAYLKRPEPEANWDKKAEEAVEGVRVVTLDLTSQVWRGIPWRHDLRVFLPQKPEFPGLAALLVTGGHSTPADQAYGVGAARSLGVPFAILYGVPNQPLFGGKLEDDLIAHTFEEFVRTGEADWPLLFPMVKSAAKAMDAVQALTRERGEAGVARFVVTGASKRGWTTWLTGAADPRVAGIAPLVFDNLNLPAQMRHQMASWGEYSHMIGDYTRRNLQALLETEAGRTLAGLVDPWSFRDRLERIPKLIVNGTNDPYWTSDAITHYWDGLKGDKAVVYVPNGGHGISADARGVNARVAFVRRLGAGRSLPPLRWEHGEAAGALALRMTCTEAPAAARVWVARAPTRDFRKARWDSRPLETGADGAFAARLDRPAEGFVAWFGEADFREGELPFSLSTTVRLAGPAAPPPPGLTPPLRGARLPRIEEPWWTVAGNPDLGDLGDPKQQPVDFALWQAADGTWQLWSCIRNTRCGGKTRLFHRWEGRSLTEPDWAPKGIAMQADPALGETPGGLQAPFVLKVGNLFHMYYGDWQHIGLATSRDGKTFTRAEVRDGRPQLFFEASPEANTRDAMVLRTGGRYHCYYTAHPERKGAVYCRTSEDLKAWGESRKVAAGGLAGDGPYAAECPFVVRPPGSDLLVLFRTQRYGMNAQTTLYASPDPMDFGVDDDRCRLGTLPVAAPEILEHDGAWYIAALRPDLKGIRIARLIWDTAENP